MIKYKVKVYCDRHSFAGVESCFPFNAKFIFIADEQNNPILYDTAQNAISAGALYIAQNSDWHFEVLVENKVI